MIAVFSDIHGNLPALQAVLQRMTELGCERVISLGDVAGYYAQPGECVDLLREHDAINIMGNHDYYLVSGTDCPRSKMVAMLADYQRGIVRPDQVAWLAHSLPVLMEGGNYFTHGGWDDPQDQYLYRVAPSSIPEGARRLFTGHTHVQALLRFGEKEYCNPGSVGQPRDGDPRAAFAVLVGDEVTLHRVEYDIDRTAFAMQQAGFPPRYYENLYAGTQIGGRVDKVRAITDDEVQL
jgi:predicted phosphodiesterase